MNAGENDCLVGYNSRSTIYFKGITTTKLSVLFGACNKESRRLIKSKKALEIEVSPIHNID